MIKGEYLKKRLEEVLDMLDSDYSPEQWKFKEEIDLDRYQEAKKLYDEANDAISMNHIDWSTASDEEYDTISRLIDTLDSKIDMIEEDLFWMHEELFIYNTHSKV